MNMYSRQLAARNADDEIRFQRLVLEENLSLEDQFSYRQSQQKRAAEDPQERRRISKEISTLKDLAEQKKFSDAYLDKIIAYESGATSVDSILNWLKDKLSSTTDLNIKSSIQTQIVEKEREKFSLTQQMIKNQTEYAVKDKTESILNNQISSVSSSRNEAILTGNDNLVSVYDLQLQALNKAKIENTIDNSIRNFAISTVAGNSNATGLLDAYNNKIASASTVTPVTVAGVTYSSEREFWAYKRDSYVSDTSSAGFFTRFNDEKNLDIKVKNSEGYLTRNDLMSASNAYNLLMGRPELQGYDVKLNAYRQDTLQSGADLLANKIYHDYQYDYDVNKAISNLDNLKNLGVNIDDVYTKVTTKATEIKGQQVSGIKERAGEISYTTGMAPTEATKQAAAEGAGVVLSPAQAVSKPAEQIVGEMAAGYEQKAFGTDIRTTATTAPEAPPIVPPQPTPPILISKQLDYGMSDAQIKALQQFLNKQGFAVAAEGPGAPGQETEYFGPLTQAALQKFQSAQGIVTSGTPTTTGYGRVGPQTLAAIQKLLK